MFPEIILVVVLAVTQCPGVMELTLCPAEGWDFTRGGDMGQAGRHLELGKVLEGFCVNKCYFIPSHNEGGQAGGVVWPGMAAQNWEGEKLKEKW